MTMTRYYFHTSDGQEDRDTDGVELASDADARVYAVRYAGMVLAGEPEVVWDGRVFRVHVANDAGEVLFNVISSVEQQAGCE